jgi:hypothetical protein
VAPVRDGERPAERDGGRVGTRGRDGARGAAEVTDRVTISPAALRGLPGGGGDEGAESSGGGDGAADARGAEAEGADFRSAGEALLLARGLANAVTADPTRASRVHGLVSPARAAALLRG